MTLPNLITLLRLVLVPLVIVMILHSQWVLAFAFFLTAGISDALDGWIARQFDMRSELGAYLDAVADKALLVSIYVTLSMTGILPVWLSVLVVSRDLMIVGAVLVSWLMEKPLEIKPRMISKVNTAVQIAFAALLLGVKAFGLPATLLIDSGLFLVAGLTIASAGVYLAQWLEHMAA